MQDKDSFSKEPTIIKGVGALARLTPDTLGIPYDCGVRVTAVSLSLPLSLSLSWGFLCEYKDQLIYYWCGPNPFCPWARHCLYHNVELCWGWAILERLQKVSDLAF